jgi:hypothetical protein
MDYVMRGCLADNMCIAAQQSIFLSWGRISLTEWGRLALLPGGQKSKIKQTLKAKLKLSSNEKNK